MSEALKRKKSGTDLESLAAKQLAEKKAREYRLNGAVGTKLGNALGNRVAKTTAAKVKCNVVKRKLISVGTKLQGGKNGKQP